MCAVFAVFSSVCAAQQSWLILGGDGRWKRYAKESNWRKAVDELQPLETAVINQTATNITIVYDVQGESGDWRDIDRYLFQPNGGLLTLSRKFASVSQDILLTQVFVLDASGTVRKTLESEVSLNTGKPKKETSEVPQLPIASNAKQLNFMNHAR
jgi:hypothetical protein